MNRALPALLLFAAAIHAQSAHRYEASGMVLSVDAAHGTLLISHDAIPGYMDAMTMPYRVADPSLLQGLKPGDKIDFTLVVSSTSSYISRLKVHKFDSLERDPEQVRRLELLDQAMRSQSVPPLTAGQTAPDFSLTDQSGHHITLSEFRGKVVAITFIYTRCPLPDYCIRLSNNFARLQQRFDARLGRDLVLLSISFDPEHDQPDVLARYAATFKANLAGWHFLTGELASVKHVCAMFGVNFWPDEGLMTHSLHTVIVGREGKLVANLEGNQYTAVQLGDLVETALKNRHTGMR